MKCIIYYYSDTGILTLEYYDGPKQKKNRYIGYSLCSAIKKFRQDNGLIGKHVRIIKLY